MDDMIIVGASGGIGGYLRGFFSTKNRVFSTYNKHPIRGVGTVAQVDVTKFDQVYLFSDSIMGDLGDRVILVYAAGISIDGMGHKLSSAAFEDVLHVNLTGAFNVCHSFLPIMRHKGWGRIILLSSVVGHAGVVGTSAYSASKAGLSGLARTLAMENAMHDITVNVLNLGYMSIGMIDTIPDGILDNIRRSVPMQRLGDVKNIAEAIRFLVAADYVTGTEIRIDGGWLCL